MGVSLKPSDAVAGGGLLDDVDVTLTELRFALYDYDGKAPAPTFGMWVKMEAVSDGSVAEQFYSGGDPKHFVPAPDGKSAVPVSGETGLNENTNAMAFIGSLTKCGFPEDQITDSLACFEGSVVHINRIPQPKRPGLTGPDKKPIPMVTKLVSMPGEGAAANTPAPAPAAQKAKGKAATPKAAASAPAGNIADKAVGVILAVVTAKGGKIAKSAIAQEAFKYLTETKDPDRNAVAQMVYKDEFLSQADQPWSFDGTTISM
jgi:hypothetical protein